jgi:integrase
MTKTATRRTRGTGGLTETQPGVWRAKAVRMVDGKRKDLSRVFRAADRDLAQQMQRAWLNELDGIPATDLTGFFLQNLVVPVRKTPAPVLTVADYLTEWVERTAPNLAASTLRHRRTNVDRITEVIGPIALGDLTPAHCADLYIRLANGDTEHKPLAKGSTLNIRTCLVTALSDAVFPRALIPVNVASQVKLPRPYPVPEKARSMDPTPEQVGELLTVADSRDPVLGLMTLVLADTGQRNAEVRGLLWTDLDLEAGTLLVNHSLTEGTGAVRKARKQAGKAVTVKLSEALTARLQAHRATTDGTGYVFSLDGGQSPIMEGVVRRFMVACQAQVPGWPVGAAPVHCLRHAKGTNMLAAGASLADVADALGDTVAVVAQTYVKPTVAGRDRWAEATSYA